MYDVKKESYLQIMKPITASNRNNTAQMAPPIIPALSSSGLVTLRVSPQGRITVAFFERSPRRVICAFERLLVPADT